jgi:hypothetical protein
MNNELIPIYTPLWQGDSDCNKCDSNIIPVKSEYTFALPFDEVNPYVLTIEYEGTPYELELIRENFADIHICKVTWLGDLLNARLGGTLDALDVSNGCYNIRLRQLITAENEYEERGNIGQVVFTDRPCSDFLKIEYILDCEQETKYTYFLDAVLARQPLSLAEELNAVSPSGLSRRVFSRTQQTKELRIRPLTLATHELLEYVLNLPSFEINGTTYTQAEGELYTYVDAGSSGYYVGRVALVSGGNIFRSCCDEVTPSS